MSRENDGFVFHRDLLQWVPDVIYRAVNFFVTWDKLPTPLGAANLSGVPRPSAGAQSAPYRLRHDIASLEHGQ